MLHQVKFEPTEVSIPATQILSTTPSLPTSNVEGDAPASLQRVPRTNVVVVVPTLASILNQRRKRAVEDEDIKKMQNPKVKKPKDFTLTADTIRARLNLIEGEAKPFDVKLDKNDVDVIAPRTFLSHYYGGNRQETFPKVREEKVAEHGFNDFMYPNLLFNPMAPQVPGFPGLFFDPGTPGIQPTPFEEIKRVISRIDSGKWQYQGQYELQPAPSLTPAEWSRQPEPVQKAWAKNLLTKGWGACICVRVALRQRLGREPTLKEQKNGLKKKNLKELRKQLDFEDIIEAFTRGREVMDVWTMKCVDYDEGFQRTIAREAPLWVEPPSKAKKNQNQAARKKRRQAKVEESDEEEDIPDYDHLDNDDDDDEEDGMVVEDDKEDIKTKIGDEDVEMEDVKEEGGDDIKMGGVKEEDGNFKVEDMKE